MQKISGYFIIIFILLLNISCSSNPKQLSTAERQAKIYFNQGSRFLAEGSYTEALALLMKANELNPNNTYIKNNLAMAYHFKGSDLTAIKNLKKAIELDPKHTDAKLNLATIFMKNKDYTNAEKLYLEVSKDLIYTEQYKTFHNLGLLALKRHQTSKAIDYFQKSIKEAENYCPAHFQLGQIQMRQHQYEKALDSFKNAHFGVCYENPSPLYFQAMALIKLQRSGEARLKFQHLTEKFPLTPWAKRAKRQLVLLDHMLRQSEELDEKSMQVRNEQRNLQSPGF